MKKILIRADGGKRIGMGHIMRMLVLANELKKKCEVIFLCINNSYDKYLAGIEKIKENGFKIELISEDNIVSEIIKIQQKQKANLLITDSYDIDEHYFDELEDYFDKTAYIDDINICRINVDIIINQNINANEYKYNTYPNKKTKFFLGSKYVLLRDEFRKQSKKKVKLEVKDITLTVGGMDDKWLTLKVMEALTDFKGNLHVIIGGAFEKRLVETILKFKSDKLKIIPYENAVMSEVMEKCDLAISGCGSTLYELCAIGIPTIGIVIADNQKKVAETMDEKHVIINTNDIIYKDISVFKEIVFKVIGNMDIRNNLVKESRKCVSVNGAKNLCEEIVLIIS